MAKKKTVKKIKSVSFLGTKMPLNETLETKVSMVEKKVRSAIKEVSPVDAVVECINQIAKTNKRIDAIVAAHDKCKSLKGL